MRLYCRELSFEDRYKIWSEGFGSYHGCNITFLAINKRRVRHSWKAPAPSRLAKRYLVPTHILTTFPHRLIQSCTRGPRRCHSYMLRDITADLGKKREVLLS
jgi:hypothetical protein